MTVAVWKFKLEVKDRQSIEMPQGAEILDIQTQNNEICIWALVDIDAKMDVRHFEVWGTGHKHYYEDYKKADYLGSVQTENGKFVWHIFEVY